MVMNAPALSNDHKIRDNPNVAEVQFHCGCKDESGSVNGLTPLPTKYPLNVFLAESNVDYHDKDRPPHYIMYAQIQHMPQQRGPSSIWFHLYFGTDAKEAIDRYMKLVANADDYRLIWTPETGLTFHIGHTRFEQL